MSPPTTTGSGVAAGPETSSAACGFRMSGENASRCVVTNRNEVPRIRTSTDAQPRGSLTGPATVFTVSAAA